jgi:hypothetical protein
MLGCIPYLLAELYIIYNTGEILEGKETYKKAIIAIGITILLIFIIEKIIYKILDKVKDKVKKS